MMSDNDDFEERPSKSQRKRDMQALKDMAARLVELPADQTGKLEPDIRDAVAAARKITKGNARKRQVQYIAKLLSRTDVEPVRMLIDTLDASTAAHVNRFHQLERWREQLIEGDASAMQEILSQHPGTDRQQLRQLVRAAVAERDGPQQQHYRKLFQFLKQLPELED